MSASLRTQIIRLTGKALAAGKPGAAEGLASSAIRTMAVRVGGMGLNFLLGIALARWLGKEGFGVYAFANSWVALLTPLLIIGLDRLMVKDMAAYRATENWPLMRGVAIRAVQLCAAASVLGALVAGFCLSLAGKPEEAAKTAVVIVAFIGLPLRVVASVLESGIRGLDKVSLSQIPDNLVTPGLMLVSIVACWIFVPADPKVATTLNVAINAVVCVLMGVLFWRELPGAVKTVQAEYQTSAWLKVSMPFAFVSVLLAVSKQTPAILLGHLRSTDLVGVYAAASRGSDLIWFPLIVINLSLAPAVARLYARNEMEQLQVTVTKATRAAFAISLLLCGAMMLGAHWFLLILGDGFTSGATALRILCATQFFNALMGSVGVLMSMTKHEKAMASSLLLSTVVTVALDFALIPPFGVEGAAVAFFIGYVVWNCVMVAIVIRQLGINPTIFGGLGRRRPAASSDY
jgi:O-antigen/teichoic acid export membrane protein